MPTAVIDVSASGDSAAVVAALANHRVVIENYTFQSSGTVDIKFVDSDGTEIIPELSNVDTSGISSPHNPHGLFETGVGKGLKLNLSGNVQVSGHINYHYRYSA